MITDKKGVDEANEVDQQHQQQLKESVPTKFETLSHLMSLARKKHPNIPEIENVTFKIFEFSLQK